MSNGIIASITPLIPPSVNMVRKPSANSIGVSRWSTPRHSVASHEKILIPVGIAMIAVVIIIGIRIHGCMPGDEHVVRPHREPEHDDRQQREGHHPVAEDRLARLDGEDLGDDPEPGQHHDVDRRVRVEPEDVLVHDHVAVLAGADERVEEVEAERPVEQHEELRGGDERGGDHDQQRGREVRPHEQRHPEEAHPRRAHRDDRDQEVQRGRDRGGARELHRDR